MYVQKKVLPELLIFARAQLSAFLGGIVDFVTMIILTEIFGMYYVYSIIAGGIIGAIANFSVNKYWAFGAQHGNTSSQVLKFSIVVVGSILLKSYGTYLLSESLMIKYYIARIGVDAFVCFGFNYVLHRIWVFKK